MPEIFEKDSAGVWVCKSRRDNLSLFIDRFAPRILTLR